MKPRFTDLPTDHPARKSIEIARRDSTQIDGFHVAAIGEEHAVSVARRLGVIYQPLTPHLDALDTIEDEPRRVFYSRDHGLELRYERRARRAYENLFKSGWAERDDDAANAARLASLAEARREQAIKARAQELAAEATRTAAAKFRRQAEREVAS